MKALSSALLISLALSIGASAHEDGAAAATSPNMKKEEPAPASPAPSIPDSASSDVSLGINRALVVERPSGIRRIAIANGEIAEAVAVNSKELLLNGKTQGDTTLIVWDPQGNRSNYTVHVTAPPPKLDDVRTEIQREAGPNVILDMSGGTIFLRGTVKDTTSADRAYNIAATLGKVINLLRVETPAGDPQILLKVRFADVDRSAAQSLGINIFGADPSKGIGSSSTGQFGASPGVSWTNNQSATINVSDFLNLFFFRPDLNVGAVIQALQAKNLLQILAEPNLLTASGRPASFLAGGEFPFPTLQGGGAGVGQITIQFKEFGIRLNFLPTVTPRGTIRLLVMPEVSSLDYANGLNVSGYTVPGLDTRRVQTEVELSSGQSLVIAGLLNNQAVETLSKIPGLANIPLLGKLFESRSITKSNTELMIMVTPELVGPIPAGMQLPQVSNPLPFLKDAPTVAPQNPLPQATGGVAPLIPVDSLPIEELKSFTTQQNAPMGNMPPSNGGASPFAMPQAAAQPNPFASMSGSGAPRN
ncbi:MAG: pilus assembly protein N-terminal domain-containing protein [Acidobacteriaceae bacterium]|nr:pilus assembly protein N-terminal domain-containing protein [Acidobacteriaceae bacterium]